MFGWRRWLIFPNCSNVPFLSQCTNDYSTAGGAWGCEKRGTRKWWCAWGYTICLVACQGVSGLQPSHTCHESKIPPSAQDCSASIYQVFAKLWCKPIWISQSHLIGLGHVPVVAWSFTGLQHRERAHTITFIPQPWSQVGHVLHLPELWQLALERATDVLNCTASLGQCSWLQISGNRGRTLAKEGDYNRHLPLWLNIRRCKSF